MGVEVHQNRDQGARGTCQTLHEFREKKEKGKKKETKTKKEAKFIGAVPGYFNMGWRGTHVFCNKENGTQTFSEENNDEAKAFFVQKAPLLF